MPRLITLSTSIDLHNIVATALTEQLGRTVICSPPQNGDAGKVFFAIENNREYNQVHVGSWLIKNGKIQAFTTEEVEDAELMTA